MIRKADLRWHESPESGRVDSLTSLKHVKNHLKYALARASVPVILKGMDVWQETLKLLKKDLNPTSFKTWFASTSLVHRSPESISVLVTSNHIGEWLQQHYFSQIQAALTTVAGSGLTVYFVTDARREETTELPLGASAASETDEEEEEEVIEGPESLDEDVGRHMVLNPSYTFDNFVIGKSNDFAANAAISVADNPGRGYNPLFVYGGVGLGKTHLLQAIGVRALAKNSHLKVLYRTTEEFTNDLINSLRNKTMQTFRRRYREVDIFLLDDIQFIAGKDATQEEFFHTFNTLHQAGKQIVVSADVNPNKLPTIEERLRSRFLWGLICDVKPPELETKVAILHSKAEKIGMELPEEVAFFIANHITSNVRALEGSLSRLWAYRLHTKRPLDLPLAREVLGDLLPGGERKVSVDLVKQVVARRFKMKEAELTSKKKARNIAYPRQIAMFLTRELTELSTLDIGREFGKRDHSTVIHACTKVKEDIEREITLKNTVESIKNEIIQENSLFGPGE